MDESLELNTNVCRCVFFSLLPFRYFNLYFSDSTTMDLKKIHLYEEHYEKKISDEDIVQLENGRIIPGGYFQDSKCGFDFLNLPNYDKVKLYIWNMTQDDDRIFIKYSMRMSNGRIFGDCSWGDTMIPLLSSEEIRAWEKPRQLWLRIQIGIYSGTGGEKWQWQNIFTEAEDFFPLSSLPTFHSKCMNDLQECGTFSDVKLLCSDSISIG